MKLNELSNDMAKNLNGGSGISNSTLNSEWAGHITDDRIWKEHPKPVGNILSKIAGWFGKTGLSDTHKE